MDKQAIIDKAAVLLDYIATGIEKGGEFVAGQAPLLAQEILSYGLAYHGVWLGMTSLMLIICIWGLKRSLQELATGSYHDDGPFVGVILSCFSGLMAILFMITNLLSLLKITYAPRLYLLEVIKGLV